MTSILDIGPLTETVTINGVQVEMRGASAKAIFDLLLGYPQLRKIIAQKAVDATIVQEIVEQLPETVNEIIAAGVGQAGDTAHIAWASMRTAGEQYEMLSAILRMTFPQGLQSFLDGLQKVQASVEGRGWGQGTKSPARSNSASAAATQ